MTRRTLERDFPCLLLHVVGAVPVEVETSRERTNPLAVLEKRVDRNAFCGPGWGHLTNANAGRGGRGSAGCATRMALDSVSDEDDGVKESADRDGADGVVNAVAMR